MKPDKPRSPRGIYAIVDGDYLAPEKIRPAAAALAEGGVRWIQLRHKNAVSRVLFDAACELAEEFAGTGVTFLVNDRADVAIAAEADGVHLGQEDLPALVARTIVGDRVLGLSTHTVQEAHAAAELPVDYVGVGPVFASGTKSGHADVLGVDGLHAMVEASAFPVVAIGGVTLERVASVRRAGADAAAMIAALLEAGDIRSRAQEAVQAWKEGER